MEWYYVCWPWLTAKRVEPVVSISWASCLYCLLLASLPDNELAINSNKISFKFLWKNYISRLEKSVGTQCSRLCKLSKCNRSLRPIMGRIQQMFNFISNKRVFSVILLGNVAKPQLSPHVNVIYSIWSNIDYKFTAHLYFWHQYYTSIIST